MAQRTYWVSAALGLGGTATGVYGIAQGEFKPVAIGFILILGAAVFAILYLGTRRSASPRLPDRSALNAGNME